MIRITGVLHTTNFFDVHKMTNTNNDSMINWQEHNKFFMMVFTIRRHYNNCNDDHWIRQLDAQFTDQLYRSLGDGNEESNNTKTGFNHILWTSDTQLALWSVKLQACSVEQHRLVCYTILSLHKRWVSTFPIPLSEESGDFHDTILTPRTFDGQLDEQFMDNLQRFTRGLESHIQQSHRYLKTLEKLLVSIEGTKMSWEWVEYDRT